MSLNKLIPATLVLLALTGSTAFAGTCRFSGSTNLMGSTTVAKRLDHYSSSSSDRIVGETCQWTITCPAGSFIGATDFQWDVNSGDSIQFSDADGSQWAPLDTWDSSISTSTRYNRRFLYPNTNKLVLQYNTTTSGSWSFVGYGFDLSYMCFTSTCPSQLVNYKTYSTAVKSGFEFRDYVVPGTSCSFNFACSNTADRPQLNYYKGSYVHSGWSMTIAGSAPASSYSVPTTSTTGNSQLAAATSYTVTYTAPTSATGSDPSWSSLNTYTTALTVWAGCQAATESTCLTGMYRNGATLSAGYGLVASDPDGKPSYLSSTGTENLVRTEIVSGCEYQVTCPSTASGISFTGAVYSTTVGSAEIRSTAGATTPARTFTSSSPSTYAHSSTSAYVYLGTSSTSTFYSSYVEYSCRYSQCYSSAQSGFHMQTTSLSSTTLKGNTLVPQTDSSQEFLSDQDGASSSSQLSASENGQICSFTATCPTGYYVMLNISGYFVDSTTYGTDRVYATGGGKVYDFTYTGAIGSIYTSYVYSYPRSIITAANSLSWTQSAHYYSSSFYGTGYSVTAGCTSFVAGTCPWNSPSTHFSSLTTAASNTHVTLDTYTLSTTDVVPVGYSCAWPITCPAGLTVQLTLMAGFSTWTSNPDLPVVKDASGTTLTYSAAWSTFATGVNAVTVSWATTTLNTTSTYGGTGFTLNASCGVFATPAPTSSQCTASAQAGLFGTTTALSSTTLKADTQIPMTTSTQDFHSDADGVSSSNQLSSSQSGQLCEFAVTCPTGYYVMLNATGRFVYSGGYADRVYATGAGKVYDFVFPASSSFSTFTSYQSTDSMGQSVITAANTLTWTQSAHYYVFGRGYTITAGCTSFVAGTCPYSGQSTHFSSLATAALGTEVVLDNYVASSSYPTIPTGFDCSWPITCPTGSSVAVTWDSGVSGLGSSSNIPVLADSSGNSIYFSTYASGAISTYQQTVTLKWATTNWNATSTYAHRGFRATVKCSVQAATATPLPISILTPSNSTPSPVTFTTLSGCHYAQKAWTLDATVRNRMIFDYTTVAGLTQCVFTFTCPAPGYGMAIRFTKTVPFTSLLSVQVNTSTGSFTHAILGYDTVGSSYGLNLATGYGEGVQVTAIGNGGSFAMQASCITVNKVPLSSKDVNIIEKSWSSFFSFSGNTYSSSTTITSSSHSSYTPVGSATAASTAVATRRSYSNNDNKAFLVACTIDDQTTSNIVLQPYGIYGTTGTDDTLSIIALDSGDSKSFTGDGTYSSTYYSNRTNDTSVWQASSQYYVTWTSGSVPDSSSASMTFSYYCANSTWQGISGVGVDVAADVGAGASQVSAVLAAICGLIVAALSA